MIFHNPQRHHLYVAIGEPGVIEIFDTRRLKRVETVKTEAGAHTIAFNPGTGKVYAFMPEIHRASIYLDR